MSYSCSWVAARDLSLGEVLVDLELGVTGERNDHLSYGLSAIETLEDWIVVVTLGADEMGDVDEHNARSLSVDGWALFFRCDDDAMSSELIEYREGEPTWALRHPSAEAGLSVAGKLPEALDELIKDAREKAAENGDANLYDIPARIGMVLTGFRHDEPIKGGEDDPVQELEAR